MSATKPKYTIAILALQGNFVQHKEVLQRIKAYDIHTPFIKGLNDLQALQSANALDGVVLPGGESTTMAKLLEMQKLLTPLRNLMGVGLPVLATCAGTILLAKNILAENVASTHIVLADAAVHGELTNAVANSAMPGANVFSLANIALVRNAYGRQLHSFTATTAFNSLPPQDATTRADAIEGLYIRAPKITAYGAEVAVLSFLEKDPVVVQERNMLMATFHPEAIANTRLHRYFIEQIVKPNQTSQ